MKTFGICIASAILLTTPPATAARQPERLLPNPDTADYYRVRDGFIAEREGRCNDVMMLLPGVVDDPDFAGFPEFVRRGTLERIVECGEKLKRWRGATIPYLEKLIAISGDITAYRLRDLPSAAELMIRRLRSHGDQRIQALLSLQYATSTRDHGQVIPRHESLTSSDHLTPGEILLRRFDKLRDRSGVRRALDAVGRSEEVWLYPSSWQTY